ncbi:MAG TPA: sigma-54 dependent transcriptional regulator [Pyrinomonadaceae bacterium]|nr:sigma-54 dependent transcriptional regulator [Pyrinomonadaceae bacterium]
MIEIVALSDAMREVVRLAERVAATDANVLVTGESGAGKDALALFIHSRSPRRDAALVKIDCAALPSELLEAELFGYERGAFTGATEARPGRLEGAHKGTLVLDEVAHLSVDAQAKLLRVIEEREFERLGGRRTIKVDARLVALTNVDLDDAVKRRSFREDLFYRLNVMRLHLPPLRERREDIEKLAHSFLKTYATKHGRSVTGITPETLAVLQAYEFPGNVRELSNTIERAVIVAGDPKLQVADLPEALRVSVLMGARGRQRRTLAEVEADYIGETLLAVGGNKSEAARLLGISRKNLYEKLARYGIAVSGRWSVVSKKPDTDH